MRRLSTLVTLLTALSAGGLMTAAPASATDCQEADPIVWWCKDHVYGDWCMLAVVLPTGAWICVPGDEALS